MNAEQVKCAICSRVVAGHIPAGGDGSALFPARHLNEREPEAGRCTGTAVPGLPVADRRADNSGLDDGPYLPGRAPRKRPAPKPAAEVAAIRAKAWATRRARYGERGHR